MTDLANAIARSAGTKEIMRVDAPTYTTEAQALAAVRAVVGTANVGCATENNGDIDVWGDYDDEGEFRIRLVHP